MLRATMWVLFAFRRRTGRTGLLRHALVRLCLYTAARATRDRSCSASRLWEPAHGGGVAPHGAAPRRARRGPRGTALVQGMGTQT